MAYLSRLFVTVAVILNAAGGIPLPQREQEPLSLDAGQDDVYSFPTVHESAVMARRILHLTTIGTLVTTFPTEDKYGSRPADVSGSPIGQVEYYADCEPRTGDPTLLALSISTSQRNYNAGSNISLAIRWWPEQTTSYLVSDNDYDDDDDGRDEIASTPHTPAALPRFSLHGYLEDIPAGELEAREIPACFVHAHPDAKWWQPGNEVHTSRYVRLKVEHVYWIGGFGDRARIQWLPLDEWRNVTMEEIAACRLPGEKSRRH